MNKFSLKSVLDFENTKVQKKFLKIVQEIILVYSRYRQYHKISQKSLMSMFILLNHKDA